MDTENNVRSKFRAGVCAIRVFLITIWTFPFIPSFGLRSLLEGKVPFYSLQQVHWRFWIITGSIGLITVSQCHDLALQRFFNYGRTICKCDIIKITRMSDTVEGAVLWWKSSNPDKLRDYFLCRSVCP